MKNNLLTTFWVILLLPSMSFSQDQKGGMRKFTVAVFEKIASEKIYYRNVDKLIPIDFKVGRRSEVYELSNEHGLELYIKYTDPEGNSANKLIGKPKKEKGYKQALYFIDRPTKDLKLRIFETDDTLKNYPKRSFRFLNLTNKKMGIKLDGKPKAIGSGSVLTFPITGKDKNFVSMALYSTKGTLLAGSRMYCQPNSREFIIIYPPSHKREKIKLNYLNQLLPE